MIACLLNGEAVSLPAGDQVWSIKAALAYWGYQPKQVAVAVNQVFVPRDKYAAVRVSAGDAVEVVAPLQGG